MMDLSYTQQPAAGNQPVSSRSSYLRGLSNTGRLNCISHLLGMIPYKDLTPDPIVLPPRQDDRKYKRPPLAAQNFVPQIY